LGIDDKGEEGDDSEGIKDSDSDSDSDSDESVYLPEGSQSSTLSQFECSPPAKQRGPFLEFGSRSCEALWCAAGLSVGDRSGKMFGSQYCVLSGISTLYPGTLDKETNLIGMQSLFLLGTGIRGVLEDVSLDIFGGGSTPPLTLVVAGAGGGIDELGLAFAMNAIGADIVVRVAAIAENASTVDMGNYIANVALSENCRKWAEMQYAHDHLDDLKKAVCQYVVDDFGIPRVLAEVVMSFLGIVSPDGMHDETERGAAKRSSYSILEKFIPEGTWNCPTTATFIEGHPSRHGGGGSPPLGSQPGILYFDGSDMPVGTPPTHHPPTFQPNRTHPPTNQQPTKQPTHQPTNPNNHQPYPNNHSNTHSGQG